MGSEYRRRRSFALIIILAALLFVLLSGLLSTSSRNNPNSGSINYKPSLDKLSELKTSPKTSSQSYQRSFFGSGWTTTNGCDTRNLILYRDLTDTAVSSECLVLSGVLADPYSGQIINFKRGENSSDVQIDHVVALNDAWLSGAESLTTEERIKFANDPLELLAVSGKQNQAKLGSDASQWLPPNKTFKCTYVARQIDIKAKYKLTISSSENDVMKKVLSNCGT